MNLDQACQMGWQQVAQGYFFGRDFDAFRPAAERAISLNPRNGDTIETVQKHYAPFVPELRERVREILESASAGRDRVKVSVTK